MSSSRLVVAAMSLSAEVSLLLGWTGLLALSLLFSLFCKQNLLELELFRHVGLLEPFPSFIMPLLQALDSLGVFVEPPLSS